MPLLLEGQVDDRDQLIEQMQDEIQQLQSDLLVAKAEASRAVQQSSRAVANLRRQLSPLYQALRAVFGEIEAVGGGTSDEASTENPRVNAVWESWKNKLGGKKAAFIQALQEHGAMTAEQIRVATHTGSSTVPQVIYELKKLGLITKDNDKYSLKKL